MEYRIVDAERKHLIDLEDLEKQCFSLPWTVSQLESQLPDDNHIFIVAESDAELLGYVGMMYVLDEGYISNVAVNPNFRRKGLADALINTLEEKSRDKDISFISLEVRESNQAAILLYEKHGFVPVGRRKNYYDLPREDAIIMTKFMK